MGCGASSDGRQSVAVSPNVATHDVQQAAQKSTLAESQASKPSVFEFDSSDLGATAASANNESTTLTDDSSKIHVVTSSAPVEAPVAATVQSGVYATDQSADTNGEYSFSSASFISVGRGNNMHGRASREQSETTATTTATTATTSSPPDPNPHGLMPVTNVPSQHLSGSF